jgi:anti-anti-sigma factor
MRVEVKPNKKKKGFYTIVPHGSIDSDSHSIFRTFVGRILDKSARSVLIDLKHVDYISSAGFGVLFSIQDFLKKQKGELLFCNLKPQIKKLFDVMKVLPPESIFSNIEEADKYLLNVVKDEIEKQKENEA